MRISVPEGLSQSTVTSLYFDEDSCLWIGTCSGLNQWLDKDIVNANNLNAEFQGITIRSICNIDKKNLIIGTEDGFFLKNLNNNYFKKYYISADKIKDKMVKAYKAGQNLYFFVRDGYVIIYNMITHQLKVVRANIVEGKETIAVYDSGIFWLESKPYRLCTYDKKKENIKSIQLPFEFNDQALYSIQVLKNKILVSGNKGFAEINTSSNTIEYFPVEKLNISELKSTNHLIFASYSPLNEYWLGIRGIGVICLDRNHNVIRKYIQSYQTNNDENINFKFPICCVFDNSGNVFIGTDGNGLIKINIGIRKFNHILPSEICSNQVKDNFIRALYKNANGQYYFSTLNSGLIIYNPKKLKCKEISKYNKEQISNISFIAPADNDLLLVSTNIGLLQFSVSGNAFIKQLSSNTIYFSNICKLNDKFILGSEDGLFLLQQNQITKLNADMLNQISLLFSLDENSFIAAEKGDKMYVVSLLNLSKKLPIELPDSIIPYRPIYNSIVKIRNEYYVGSSFGLLRFSSKFKFLKRYSQYNGLPDVNIYTMLSDKSQKIWISTNKGISLFDPETESFRNFTESDGLQSLEFNTHSAFFADDGEMLFGGINGFNTFFPDKIIYNKVVPKIKLCEMELNDKKLNPNNLNANDLLSFSYNQNNFTFKIAAMEYTQPSKNEIKVILKGIETKWNYLKNKNSIHYPWLPSGKYELYACASNNDGYWSNPVLLLKFTINPPYWKSIWFYFLIILLFLVIMSIIYYFIYIYNLKKKIRELKQLQAIERVRINISREIHDDIGAGLTQIAILSEQLNNDALQYSEKTQIQVRTKKLENITRELLQSMSEIVWVMNPINDTLENLLIYLRKTLNRLIEDTSFDIKIIFPDQYPDIIVDSGVRRKILLILKEAVNNSIKHSYGDLILLKFLLSDQSFCIDISDNGKGFQGKINPIGNGLRNMRQHADEIGCKIDYCSDSSGFKITIKGNIEIFTTKVVKNK
ncbi:MAG: hypothetical protein HPY79_11810 [Bacteroidales bacterium]|nr:hypothetical protein [Bacteroidales bacterium]